MSKRLAALGWLGALGLVLSVSDCLFDYAGAERCANGNGGGCPDTTTSSSSSSSSMPSSCHDGAQDEQETDKDCGGDSGCPRCAPGKKCKSGSDCDSAVCDHGICAPVRYTTRWSTISSTAPPPARFAAGIAARADGTILVHGGYEVGDDGDDTWELGSGAWTSGVDTNAPAKRHQAPMAFHEGLGKALLAGGYLRGGGGPVSDTAWYSSADGWSVGPKLPRTRYGSTLVYDSKRGALLLFGGDTSAGPANDVLKLKPDPPNHLTWQAASASGPPEKRYYHAAAYDAFRDRMVIFGGVDPMPNPNKTLADTWEYHPADSTWKRLMIAGPPPLYSASMAYDAHRHVIVLYGGSDTAAYSDTWELDGDTWKNTKVAPPAATYPRLYATAMAYDAVRQRMVLVGGDYHSEPQVGTFEYIAYGDPCPDGQCQNGKCTNGVCCFVDGVCPDKGVCNTPEHPGICAAPDAGM